MLLTGHARDGYEHRRGGRGARLARLVASRAAMMSSISDTDDYSWRVITGEDRGGEAAAP